MPELEVIKTNNVLNVWKRERYFCSRSLLSIYTTKKLSLMINITEFSQIIQELDTLTSKKTLRNTKMMRIKTGLPISEVSQENQSLEI